MKYLTRLINKLKTLYLVKKLEYKFNIKVLKIFKEEALFSIRFKHNNEVFLVDDNRVSKGQPMYSLFQQSLNFHCHANSNDFFKEIKNFAQNLDIHEYYNNQILSIPFHYITRFYLKNNIQLLNICIFYMFLFSKRIQEELIQMKKITISCEKVAKKVSDKKELVYSVRINNNNPLNTNGSWISVMITRNFHIYLYNNEDIIFDCNDKMKMNLINLGIKQSEIVDEFKQSLDFKYLDGKSFHLTKTIKK
jgi:hypothetical protein